MAFESKMMIDGKVVDGESGTLTNINPANEDVLGEVADASKADMNRAIDAARRSFDETDWSTNRALRKRCLLQLHDAIESELEPLREGRQNGVAGFHQYTEIESVACPAT
ncbi:hypothetical protein A5758_06565 [Mycobacterium sp. 852014-50255_SCH5639931]|nr:hypothetical protein A5758_06565 [Mycobacterium sp. 852014-50255_SCH5639931]